MKDEIILTDVDGVLLRWEAGFSKWMQARGYELSGFGKDSYYLHDHYVDLSQTEAGKLCRTFNESASIGFLDPMRDSVYYVKLLHEKHGYKFRAITSMSLDRDAQKLREMNLANVYGNAIESVICLDTGADKDVALEPYRDSGMWWIEDKYKNFELGLELGLNSILMKHSYNYDANPKNGLAVHNWKEIYEIITGCSET